MPSGRIDERRKHAKNRQFEATRAHLSFLAEAKIESGKLAVVVNFPEAAASARAVLDVGDHNASRVLLAEHVSSGAAAGLIETPHVDGLLLTDSTYGIVVDILAAIADSD